MRRGGGRTLLVSAEEEENAGFAFRIWTGFTQGGDRSPLWSWYAVRGAGSTATVVAALRAWVKGSRETPPPWAGCFSSGVMCVGCAACGKR